MAFNLLFVTVQAAVDPVHVATAVSTLFLCNTVGSIVGVTSAGAVMQEVLRRSLEVRLRSLGLRGAARLKE